MSMAADSTLAMAKRIEIWPIDRLVPYARNPRTHDASQLAQLRASIQQFGFTNPILVDGQDGVIAGHGRLEAARDLGLQHVPVVVLDHLTAEQKRAYVIADNKLALNAGWDMSLLQQEAMALSMADFDMELLGFDADELGELLGSGEFDGAEDEEKDEEDEGPNRGIALAIVLTPEEMLQWRRAKAELGYSTDKAAFWKLVEDVLEEVE